MTLIPTLIDGVMGETDESLLDKIEGGLDNENETTKWVEYRLKGQDTIIHRSVHVHLKTSVMAESAVQNF